MNELLNNHCALIAEAGSSIAETQEKLGQVDDDTTKKVDLHVTQARKNRLRKSSQN